jgi:hypothetical protein
VLLSSLSAVRLREHAEAQSGFCVLPAGQTVAVCGGSSISGLIDITCNGQAYGVFLTDLEERGKPVHELRAEHSGIRFRIPD